VVRAEPNIAISGLHDGRNGLCWPVLLRVCEISKVSWAGLNPTAQQRHPTTAQQQRSCKHRHQPATALPSSLQFQHIRNCGVSDPNGNGAEPSFQRLRHNAVNPLTLSSPSAYQLP
jgi:hypothetical protein